MLSLIQIIEMVLDMVQIDGTWGHTTQYDMYILILVPDFLDKISKMAHHFRCTVMRSVVHTNV